MCIGGHPWVLWKTTGEYEQGTVEKALLTEFSDSDMKSHVNLHVMNAFIFVSARIFLLHFTRLFVLFFSAVYTSYFFWDIFSLLWVKGVDGDQKLQYWFCFGFLTVTYLLNR